MSQRIGYPKWYKTAIDREELKKLTRRSDLKGLLYMGSFLILAAGTLFGALYYFLQNMWVPMIVVGYIHAAIRSFIGMESAAHELSHGTVFKTKWLNSFFYNVFCFFSWNNPVHFRRSHREHHHYTVHKEHDKEVWDLPIGLGILSVVSMLTLDVVKIRMYIFPTVAHVFGKAHVDYFAWDPLFEKGSADERKMLVWSRGIVLGHLALLAVFIYFKLWVLIVLVNFGYFFATFFAKGCGMLQHKGLPSEVPDWRAVCYNTKLGPIMGFLYCNMQYHIDHHMFAGVPFYNLPKLNKLLKHDLPEPLKGYWRGIAHIFRISNKQKKDPLYRYWQPLPNSAAPYKR